MPEIVKKNPVNDPTQKSVKTHSKFTPNYSRYDTHRFGLNTPHFAMAGVADDDISMRCSADVDTFTLKAPLMQPVKRNMDYFQMSLRAMLPHNAELIITNPLFGDDIDPYKANAVIDPTYFASLIASQFQALLNSSVSGYSASSHDLALLINSILWSYQGGKMFVSAGALPKYLGYSWDTHFKYSIEWDDANGNHVYEDLNFDTVFERLFEVIDSWMNKFGGGIYLPINREVVTVGTPSGSGAGTLTVTSTSAYRLYGSEVKPNGVANAIDIYDLIDIIEETNEWITCNQFSQDDVTLLNLLNSADLPVTSTGQEMTYRIWNYWQHEVNGGTLSLNSKYDITWSVTPFSEPVNVLRLVAYQGASAEFYTSDKVDNVYSCKLFLENQFALATQACYSLTRFHEVNGVPVQYDAFSGSVLEDLINSVSWKSDFSSWPGTATYYTGYVPQLLYWHNLLAFTRSLKYEDYFVGARKQPLAVGDVTVGVDTGTNTVDVIDVTKKIQVQRFLNQVNRIGRKFSDYVKGILGDRPQKDMHEPIFLGHVVDTFGAEETDNTGDGQLMLPNSTTSKLRNNSSRYGFDVHIGEPSIVIGITNYDIVRVYSSYTDRENMHVDRYDMFNPFMQFVGDQPISIEEARPNSAPATFGYTLRYMEYKQKVDQCAGGFAAGLLPGYARIVKPDEIPLNINSDFIRSHVNEMDQFYLSMTGKTPASRWNFIVRVDNQVSANRPMAYAPSIL